MRNRGSGDMDKESARVQQSAKDEGLVKDQESTKDLESAKNEESAKDESLAKVQEKIAVLRCETVSEVCAGAGCFKAFNARRLHFANTPQDAELIGFFTCGGCSGRRVSRLVKSLQKSGLTTIHLSSCMLLVDEYPRCPHLAEIKETISKQGIKIVEGTHH